MTANVCIQMMGEFVITVGGKEIPSLVARSRKGVALIEYLILNFGKEVPKQRLQSILWSNQLHANPENALKTLVSRLRKLLNDECEGLGRCIGSTRGAYFWNTLPGMQVDLPEILHLFEQIPREKNEVVKRELFDQLLKTYKGDLFLTGDIEAGASYQAALHSQYINAIYEYIEFLNARECYNQIVKVCENAFLVDTFDERLHLEMMQALAAVNRNEEAMAQYEYLSELSRRHLDAEPSEEMQDFYRRMTRSGNTLKFNLDFMRNELARTDDRKGACICDYDTFREYCNLERFNMERLGCPLFIGLIMLYENEDTEQLNEEEEHAMQTLLAVLQEHLRKGDVIVRYAPTIVAVLLPTVNHTTGNMIMERTRYLFQQRCTGKEIPFHYRLGELG